MRLRFEVAAGAQFAQDVHAQFVLGEGHRLRHLYVQYVVMAEDWIVRANDPRLVKFLRVDVEEQRLAGAERYGNLANHSTEATSAADLQRALEQHQRVLQGGHAAAHERFVREQVTVAHVDDGLKNHAQIVGRY
jgi:hypothetical protein